MTTRPAPSTIAAARPDTPVIDLIKFVVASNARTWRMIALMTSAAILVAVLLGVAVLAGHALGFIGTAVVGGVPTLGALRHRRSRSRRPSGNPKKTPAP
jgi:hypothetical protein